MKIKKLLKLLLTSVATSLLVLASVVPLVAATSVYAADATSTTVPEQVNIIVHKLMYDEFAVNPTNGGENGANIVPKSLDKNGDGKIDTNNGEGIANTGHEQTLPAGVLNYDISKYGKVEFTL